MFLSGQNRINYSVVDIIYGQLGINNKKKEIINEIEDIQFKSPLKAISSGESHSLFLLMNGNVYAVGDNKYGQIGLGKDIRNVNKITEIKKLSNIKIKKIKCAALSSYVLDENGQLYSFGA